MRTIELPDVLGENHPMRWNLSRVFSPISDPVLQFNIRVTGQLYFIYSRIPVPHSSSAGCRIQK